MRQFEQDWLELGSRVARSLHYQHRRNLRLLAAHQAEEVTETLTAAAGLHRRPPRCAGEGGAGGRVSLPPPYWPCCYPGPVVQVGQRCPEVKRDGTAGFVGC